MNGSQRNSIAAKPSEIHRECALDACATHGAEGSRCHDVCGAALTGTLRVAQEFVSGCTVENMFCTPVPVHL